VFTARYGLGLYVRKKYLSAFNNKKYLDVYKTLTHTHTQGHKSHRLYEPVTKPPLSTAATTVRAFERLTAGWKAVNIRKVMRPAKVFRGFTQS